MNEGKNNLPPKAKQKSKSHGNKAEAAVQAKPASQNRQPAKSQQGSTVLSPSRSSQTPQKNIHSRKQAAAKVAARPAAKRTPPQQAANKNQIPSSNSRYAPALTQIHKSILKQDNSQGFVKAKRAADKALANKSIILKRRFVLENTLGAGGMGTVYKAKDLRKIEANDKNPYVAIKVLNDDFKNHPDAFVTLQRETSRSHRLSHPKIVTVHDFDRDGDIIYMTMELLKGLPLDGVLRKLAGNSLAPEKALPIISDICDALAYAHEKGIVHSDLKPGNIFVTKETSKVLDFGIARITAGGDEFDSGSLGALTPTYASLEMIEGQAPHPADDLYAIGLIAYELLSGSHPYNRQSADKASAAKLKPKKLSFLSKRQWQALEKALQFQRKDRLDSIEAFQNAFFQKKKFPIFKVASAFLFCSVAALTYLAIFKVDNVKDRIQELISSANICSKQEDYACALEKYQAILELQPDNSLAQKMQTQTKQLYTAQRYQQLVAEIDQCLTNNQDLLCAMSKQEQVQQLDISEEQLATIATTIETYKTQQKIKQLLSKASQCFSDNQFKCAMENSEQVLSLDATNKRAIEIKQQASQLEIEHIANNKANEIKYARFLEKGKRCLNAEDFKCAVRHFDSALNIFSRDEAQTLKQKASFEEQNQRISYAKASKLADKAEACFRKKNFSCAISSAESSLEFVEDYQRPMAIRIQAVNAQEQAKSAFVIE